MNPERKITIAFIKKFREHLDETFEESNVSSRNAKDQANAAIYLAFGENLPKKLGERDSPTFDKFTSQLKKAFVQINIDLMREIKIAYEESLTDTIDACMSQIEEYLRSSYSSKELVEISEIIDNPLIVKLLNSNSIFDVIKNEKNMLLDKIMARLSEFTKNPDNQRKMQEAMQDVMDGFKEDEDDFGEYWQERDIW